MERYSRLAFTKAEMLIRDSCMLGEYCQEISSGAKDLLTFNLQVLI